MGVRIITHRVRIRHGHPRYLLNKILNTILTSQ